MISLAEQSRLVFSEWQDGQRPCGVVSPSNAILMKISLPDSRSLDQMFARPRRLFFLSSKM